MSKGAMNLIEALQRENQKSREFIANLDQTAQAIGHKDATTAPGLNLSRAMHESLIRNAESAIASGDVVAMVEAAAAHGIGGES